MGSESLSLGFLANGRLRIDVRQVAHLLVVNADRVWDHSFLLMLRDEL